jgi:hypothetical protein
MKIFSTLLLVAQQVGIFIVVFRLKPWRIHGDRSSLGKPKGHVRKSRRNVVDATSANGQKI